MPGPYGGPRGGAVSYERGTPVNLNPQTGGGAERDDHKVHRPLRISGTGVPRS